MTEGQYPNVTLYLGFEGESVDPEGLARLLRAQQAEHSTSDKSTAEVAMTGGKQFVWFMKVGSCETLDIRDMLQELQEKTGIPGSAIKEVCRELNVRALVACGVAPGSEEILPITAFPREFIRWAADMGAAIAIDVKGWRSDHQGRIWTAPEE